MVEKNNRTMEQIHAEYGQLCTKAGHLQYNIFVFEADLKLLNDQMKELNLEAAALAKAAPSPVAASPAPAEAVSSEAAPSSDESLTGASNA